VFISLLLGTLSGIAYTFLIPLIISSFDRTAVLETVQREPVLVFGFEVSNYKFAVLFAISCLVIFAARTMSQLILSRVAIDATSRLRVKYYDAILKSPLSKLEQVGSSRLIASFTTDIKAIIQGAMMLPDLLIGGVTIIGMMLFLLYQNSDIFLFICGAIAFGVVTYITPMLLAARFFKTARDKVDQLQEGIRGNIYGVKELKLCAEKRADFFNEHLLRLEDDVRKINKTAVTIVRVSTNYGDTISFFVIGIVAYVIANYHSITQGELLASIMVLLYITGPISIIMNSFPEIINANIALNKVETLFADIPNEQIDEQIYPLPEWQTLKLSNVIYSYGNEKEESDTSFTVGPIDFEIEKGAITFIVGGNGSGKSTLSKILTGYYFPKEGSLSLDELELNEKYLCSYRNQVSAIYSDYFLFDQLLGSSKNADLEIIDTYLKKLDLTEKVSLDHGKFSTLSLSDGQKKRLALLITFLEDKELYLFDEWAAEQDPEFKKVFYFEILPYLRSKNKAVVVISHDDRYFEVADRVLTMEDGKLRSNEEKSSIYQLQK